MICVQPGKYWHCFKGNLGETAERWGGACMGLSEHYDAILSWNWNISTEWERPVLKCVLRHSKLTARPVFNVYMAVQDLSPNIMGPRLDRHSSECLLSWHNLRRWLAASCPSIPQVVMDRPHQILICPVTQRHKVQIKHTVSPSHSHSQWDNLF